MGKLEQRPERVFNDGPDLYSESTANEYDMEINMLLMY